MSAASREPRSVVGGAASGSAAKPPARSSATPSSAVRSAAARPFASSAPITSAPIPSVSGTSSRTLERGHRLPQAHDERRPGHERAHAVLERALRGGRAVGGEQVRAVPAIGATAYAGTGSAITGSRQREQRATPGGVRHADAAAVGLGHLPDDRQAEPGARRAARRRRRGRSGRRRAAPVVGDARPVVADPEARRRAASPPPSHPAGCAWRRCRAGSSPRGRGARARRRPRPGRGRAEADGGGVAARALDRLGDELVERDVLEVVGRLLAARELDHVVDER